MFKRIVFVILIVSILTVSSFAAPVILSQPQNVYFPSGTELPATANFSVLAEGENLSYQWQYRARPGLEWNNFSGSSFQRQNVSITVNQANIDGVSQYRVIVSDTDGSVASSVVSVSVGAFILNSLPQLLSWISEVGYSIFDWVGQSCTHIVSEPLLLFTVGFLAVGACIALVSRLLARS